MKKLKFISLLTTLILLFSTFMFYPVKSEATTVNPAVEVIGQWFYIKNAYTGRYLDVPYANAYATQNVWECEFTGDPAQQWKMLYISDGEFRIVPKCAAVTGSDGSTTYSVCLDIDAATNTDGSNLQLYTLHNGSNQKFGFTYMNDGSYKISTAFSSHNRVLGVENHSYSNQANIAQYLYTGHAAERWILEPVDRFVYFGERYKTDMFSASPTAFPYMSSYLYETTNFASQLLLNSGIHYTGNWSLYRKSTYNSSISTPTNLASYWETPSTTNIPWVTLSDFKYQFSGKMIWFCKGSYLTSHPEYATIGGLVKTDVIQMSYDNLPQPDSAYNVTPQYTMSVMGTTTYNGENTYSLSYRTSAFVNIDTSLLELAEANPNRYFVFYKF